MTETEYRDFIAQQRALGKAQVRQLYYDWRIRLWPNIEDDPIHREDQARGLRDDFARRSYALSYLPVVSPANAFKITGVV